jgi:hypothetical protein
MTRRTLLSWFLDCQCDFLSGTGAEKEHSKPSIAGTRKPFDEQMVMAVLARCSDRCARHAELDARTCCPGPGRLGRTPYRYASGDVNIPEPSARLLRLLVLLRLTTSDRAFEDIVKQLD